MTEKTFFCIRPYAFRDRNAIKQEILASGLVIKKTKVTWLTEDDINALYGHEKPSIYFDACREFMTNGFVEIGIIEGDCVIARLTELVGQSHVPSENAARTLRYQFGRNDPIDFRGLNYYLNPLHRSNNGIEATREVEMFQHLCEKSAADTISQMMFHLHKMRDLECVYHHHVVQAVKIGLELSGKYGGEKDVVELACWLHDISSLKTSSKDEHHLAGAQEAGEILDLLGCDASLIEKVQHCIRVHRSDVSGKPISREAEIVRAADGLANISCPPLLYFFAFKIKGLDFNAGLTAIRRKVVRSYKKIPAFAKTEARRYLRLWKDLGIL